MVNRISIKNYKAFKNASIDLKPITIFLGANSVGKSSIMKLLLLISQNTNSLDTSKTPLKINGDTIQLGSFENLIHKKILTEKLNISFDIDTINFKEYRKKTFYKILDIYMSLKKINLMYNQGFNKFDKISTELRKEEIYKKRQISNNKELDILALINDIYSLQRKLNNIIKRDKDNDDSIIYQLVAFFLDDYSNVNENKIKNNGIHYDLVSFRDLFYYLNDINNVNYKYFTINFIFIFHKNKKEIKFSKFEILSDNINLLSYEHQGSLHTLTSSFLEQKIAKKYSAKLGKSISFNQFQIKRNEQKEDNNIFVNTAVDIISNFMKIINKDFHYDNINYVDPLRAYPRRYYFLDEKDILTSLNKIDGEKMAIMLKDNTELKKKVNKWIGKFNLNVNIEQLQDTIHNIKITQNGLSLDITDVGFGISQVLPIITQGFFSTKNSTTLIEQPEIHLHPKMQAELADLFIDIVQEEKESNKRIIIETHSEYLLKRLRRRIAEGTIKNNDVAIYSFSLDEESNCGTIKKLEIDKKGAFEWPKDFYDTDMDDTINFLKYQGN